MNTQGNGATAQAIATSGNSILISDTGSVSGNYMEPETPTSIAMLNTNYIYSADSGFVGMVDGSTPGNSAGASATKYSDYWFGTARTSGNVAYDPTITIGTTQGHVYLSTQYGGWEQMGSGNNVKPVQPVVYSSDKGTLPSDKLSYLSLTEWLQSKGVVNQATSNAGFNSFITRQMVTDTPGDTNSAFDSTTGQTALQMYIPWNAYSTPTCNIRIPVELADTFVERPPVSDIAVNGYWEDNGQKTLLGIGENAVLDVDLTQKSTVTSSGLITVNSTDPRFQVYPLSTTENMAPGATKTIQFMVTQAGGSQSDGTSANPIAININSYDTYSGSLQEHDVVYCTFAATVGSNTTQLSRSTCRTTAQHTAQSSAKHYSLSGHHRTDKQTLFTLTPRQRTQLDS